MRYFVLYDENGKVLSFGQTSAFNAAGRVSKEEYDRVKAEHMTKCDYADKVYSGEITIDDVPEEYREDVTQRVEAMSIVVEPVDDPKVDEALAILRGEVSE